MTVAYAGSTVGPYTAGREIRSDSISSLQEASASDGTIVWLKLGNNLMNETVTLAALRKDADPKFLPYLPDPIAYFSHEDQWGEVFTSLEGFYTLSEVKDAYPDGLDPRDMAWMYRRLLVALGHAHQAGYVHGSVLPQAVWIHPEKHGLVLMDWDFSGSATNTVTDGHWVPSSGFNPAWKSWYPEETDVDGLYGGAVCTATDIYMAAMIAIWLIGGTGRHCPSNVDVDYQSFFNGSVRSEHNKRFDDAWKALEYFDVLLERLYGKRRYREFHMPC